MKVLAVYSNKGGVDKTTTAVNLAFLAASEGFRTLVWDLDPQGAASYFFRIKPKVKGGGKGLLRRPRAVDRAIKGTDFARLDLLPADFSYRRLDVQIRERDQPARQFSRLMKPLGKQYDWIVLDCPPSFSVVSENVFAVADALLVPLIPNTLSVRALEQLDGFLAKQRGALKARVLPFFSIADTSKVLHRTLMEAEHARNQSLLKIAIPYSAEIERMGVRRMPITAYATADVSVRSYRNLWQEIKGMV